MSPTPEPRASHGLVLGIGVVSAATLATQVLQTRLFSVMLWHHLTYMVVTVTLLGFAAGGALLALWPKLGRIFGDPRGSVSVCCSLFGLTLIGTFAILARTPLDTLDIERDRVQYFYLFLHYAYLVVPFLCAGLAIAVALQQFAASVHRTYFWNLLGSGIGSFLFLLTIRPLGGPGSLFLFASLGGVAGWLTTLGWRGLGATTSRVLATAALALWPASLVLPAAFTTLVPIQPARSKALRNYHDLFYPTVLKRCREVDPAYTDPDPRLSHTRWTPLCRLDTLAVPNTPTENRRDREQPDSGPRSQVSVLQDGDAPTTIWSKAYARDNDFDAHFYGLGYRLVQRPRVLIIGSGGGNDIETALHYGASEVTAVDINGDTLRLVQNEFGPYTGDIYRRPGVKAVNAEGRSFLRREGGQYDLLQLSGTDTYAAMSSGSYIFSESYLYTEEAFDDFFAHMTPNGVICVIRFNFEPPRETVKLVATAARALRKLGIQDPARNFIVVHQVDRQAQALIADIKARGEPMIATARDFEKEPLRYSFTLMRRTPFAAAEVSTIREALLAMNQPPGALQPDVARLVEHTVNYAAGTEATPDNHYARMLAAVAAGPDAEATFHRTYEFNTTPATDDRPFFFHLHTWRDLDLFGQRSSESGYAGIAGKEPIGLYILLALLVQTTLATLLLVIVPLLRLRRAPASTSNRRPMLIYFLALGLAYLLVEITTIQRFVLYLGHPTYSLSIGLACFLVCSGLGAATAGKLHGGRGLARTAALAVVVLLALHALLLPTILRDTLAWSEPARMAMTVLCIGPLAFAMGMPFPTGLRLLEREPQGVIAWVFGVNGAASVLASILSIMIAMEAGFTAVVVTAAALYGIAALSVPRPAPIR